MKLTYQKSESPTLLLRGLRKAGDDTDNCNKNGVISSLSTYLWASVCTRPKINISLSLSFWSTRLSGMNFVKPQFMGSKSNMFFEENGEASKLYEYSTHFFKMNTILYIYRYTI